MFEDSLIEQKIKTRRGTTSLIAFILQAIIIVVIVLIPLIFTQALPVDVRNVTELVAPPPPPPPPPPAAAPAPRVQPKVTAAVTHVLTQPLKIPQKIAMVHEAPPSEAPPPVAPSMGGVVGGVPGGVAGGTIGGVLGGSLKGTDVPKLAAPQRVRVSQGVSEGLLTHKVTPEYPALAKAARVQGSVVLKAEIGKDGKVKNLQVVAGHPMLTAAAITAVKQWEYKPYFLNGQPVDVDTTITVNFTMG